MPFVHDNHPYMHHIFYNHDARARISATERKNRLGLQPTNVQLQLITKLRIDKRAHGLQFQESGMAPVNRL
jgi:hypothetical protein